MSNSWAVQSPANEAGRYTLDHAPGIPSFDDPAETLLSQICLKSIEQTFSGTQILVPKNVCHEDLLLNCRTSSYDVRISRLLCVSQLSQKAQEAHEV